jgi:hypothetical protein
MDVTDSRSEDEQLSEAMEQAGWVEEDFGKELTPDTPDIQVELPLLGSDGIPSQARM